jgi:ABC-2 type transport system ATP-binding protein
VSSQASPRSLLEVRALTRRFGEAVVLAGIDLDLDHGEAVALTGPNGSGKTTLLRCVVGSDVPTAGTVRLAGDPLDERSPAVRRRVAGVLDDLGWFPDLSAVEHLDLIARAHGVGDAETVVDGLLHELGLMEVSGQLPGSLSSGQRRRLALASALVRPRELLVLDEPEQRLDTAGLAWLTRRLLDLKQDGTAILFASHAPALVEAIADRTLALG